MVRRGKETGRQSEGQLHRKGTLKHRGDRQTWSQSYKQREREREREKEREREREREREEVVVAGAVKKYSLSRVFDAS